MNSLQITRGNGRINRKFANMRAAKERKRLNPEPIPDEPEYIPPKLPALKYATVSIRCGNDTVTFRVHRYDASRLLCRSKAQAASTIGRRVALTLDAIL